MKYIVIYKYPNSHSAIVGFTNSLENFKANNAKRSHPYNYDDSRLRLVELTEDVFAPATVEGMSNFADYLTR